MRVGRVVPPPGLGVVLVTALLTSGSTLGQSPLTDPARAEAECRLKYMRNTKSDAARSYISKACNFMELSTAAMGLGREERTFHACVLEALPGTEDDRNAVELANACRQRAWPR
jgi:hypothetical protein